MYLNKYGKYVGIEPSNEERPPVYVNGAAGALWEEGVLTKHADGYYDWRFVAADRQLSITPTAALESRPAGTYGEWEQLTVQNMGDGTGLLYRQGIPLTLIVEGFVGTLPALHVEGRNIVDEHGKRHLMVGSTELLLPYVYDRDGEGAVVGKLRQLQQLGFNNIRVLWQKDIGNAGKPWQMPTASIPPFLSLCASYGLYVQGCILADCQVVNPKWDDQWARVEVVRAITRGIPNHIEQLGNEWDKNGFSPNAFGRPTDNRLCTNASSTEGGPDAKPYWDFFTFSGQREPVNHAIREYGPVEFMYSTSPTWGGVPAICDEGFKPGVESSDPEDWRRAGAQARSGIGGRIHTEAGTKDYSRLFNEIELACAIAFVQGMVG